MKGFGYEKLHLANSLTRCSAFCGNNFMFAICANPFIRIGLSFASESAEYLCDPCNYGCPRVVLNT